MNIYCPYPDVDNYDSFYPENMKEGTEILNRFLNLGKYQNIEEKGEWKPLPVHVNSVGTKRGDFLGIGARQFTCNGRGWKILEPLIGRSVKTFSVKYNQSEYSIIKATNIIDCLDYSKSDVFRYQEIGRVLWVNKYVFREELIKGEHLFAIPEIKFNILVSQEFKDCVEKNDLEGLLFQQVV
jgi:hypothetical protein